MGLRYWRSKQETDQVNGNQGVRSSTSENVREWGVTVVAEVRSKLHRIRLDRKKDRVTKSVISRPYNQEYLDVVRVTLEYTNEATAT